MQRQLLVDVVHSLSWLKSKQPLKAVGRAGVDTKTHQLAIETQKNGQAKILSRRKLPPFKAEDFYKRSELRYLSAEPNFPTLNIVLKSRQRELRTKRQFWSYCSNDYCMKGLYNA